MKRPASFAGFMYTHLAGCFDRSIPALALAQVFAACRCLWASQLSNVSARSGPWLTARNDHQFPSSSAFFVQHHVLPMRLPL